MDFAAWFEAYLGGRWYTSMPRNNMPRIGRILMARGRDATDVAIVTSFGPCTLAGFKVVTDEVPEPAAAVALEIFAAHARESGHPVFSLSVSPLSAFAPRATAD